jgi:L-rhamnose mutarotase
MVMEVGDDFSFEKKAADDAANPQVQAWEELMWQFQQPLPWAKDGEKWVLMERIFELPAVP